MITWIENLDTQLFLFLNGLRIPCLDTFVLYFSNQFLWIPLYLLVIFLIIKKWKKSSWIIILGLLLAVTCNDQTCNFMKRNIGRLRPSHTVELQEKVHLVARSDGTFYKGGKYGFPSGHASNSIILLLFFIFYAKHRQWAIALMSLWVLLFIYSRIYLGVHYPLDLLFGLLMGFAWALLFIMLCKRILRQLKYL